MSDTAQPSPAQLVQRAYELLRLQRYDLALAEVQRALAADPAQAEAHVCGAWVLRAQKRHGEAEQAARAALHADPHATDALHVLAVVLWGQNRLREAEQAFNETLRQPGGDWTPYVLNYARLLLAQGRSPEALALAEQALARTPHAASAHEVRGRALQARGNFDAASAAYREALRLDPRNTSAQHNLGVLDLAAGRVEAAIESFQAVLRQSPGDADAQAYLLRALKARNRLYGWVTRLALWARSRRSQRLNAALGVLFSVLAALVLLPSLVGASVGAVAVELLVGGIALGMATVIIVTLWNAFIEPVFNTLLLRDPAHHFLRETYDRAEAAVTGALALALATALLYGCAALALGPQHPLTQLAGGLSVAGLLAMLLTRLLHRTHGGWRKVTWVCYTIIACGMVLMPFGIVFEIQWLIVLATLCCSNGLLLYLLGYLINGIRQRRRPRKN